MQSRERPSVCLRGPRGENLRGAVERQEVTRPVCSSGESHVRECVRGSLPLERRAVKAQCVETPCNAPCKKKDSTVDSSIHLRTARSLSRLSVELYMDLTLFYSCTFVSLVTELSCALDHSSNASALAHGASHNRLPFDMVAER